MPRPNSLVLQYFIKFALFQNALRYVRAKRHESTISLFSLKNRSYSLCFTRFALFAYK